MNCSGKNYFICDGDDDESGDGGDNAAVVGPLAQIAFEP
jgi:hypothetical protein